MSPKDKEIKHECRYVGPHEQGGHAFTDDKPASPSPSMAQTIALGILGGRLGRYHPSSHFQERMKERGFDVFDVEYVIRNGRCVAGGDFSEEYRNHKYCFRGFIDGVGFDAVWALSAEHDLLSSPLMILISGCFKTKSGRRSKTRLTVAPPERKGTECNERVNQGNYFAQEVLQLRRNDGRIEGGACIYGIRTEFRNSKGYFGVPVHKLHRSGPEIPAAGVLNRVIAMRLINKKNLLTGSEVRFIRKLCGYSATEFAEIQVPALASFLVGKNWLRKRKR